MPVITLITYIKAPVQRCFDLSRSIDLHKISTQHTHEEAIAGVTSGLIGLHECVTWKAKHFGIVQKLSTTIVEFNSPGFFVDEMTEGIFKSMRHEHHFSNTGQETKMTDIFHYESPFGWCGRLADYLFIKRYITDLLIKRNNVIKAFAESNEWMKIVNAENRTI